MDSFQIDPQIHLGLEKMTLIIYFKFYFFYSTFEQKREHVTSGI